MNFSVNQVRQLYVAKGYTSNSTAEGLISKVVKTPEDELYFLYNGVDGKLKSDFIPIKNITSAVVIDAADNVTKMRKVSVVLDSTINSGNPVAGQDYVLGINFKNFFSSGDASQYYKDAVVHVTSGMTVSNFYKAMVSALNKAFAREDGATATTNLYLTFKIGYSTSSESTEGDANWSSATATKIIIEEKEQEPALVNKVSRRVLFDVFPGTIYTGGDDLIWGVLTEMTPSTTVGNGKQIAALEWFCCGERGDQYRGVGYPNIIPTKYLVDPTKEYHLIEIHYAFTDTGVNSYRTEKELTIAVPKGASTANYTAVNNIIGAINTAYDSTGNTTLLTTLS